MNNLKHNLTMIFSIGALIFGNLTVQPSDANTLQPSSLEELAEPISMEDMFVHEVEQILYLAEQESAELEIVEEEIEEPQNRWDILLTEEEIELLACIVFLEAGNQPDEGQQAVIEVVFNRMAAKEFDDGLEEVLSAKGQFSTWKNRAKAKPTEKEFNNIQKVLNGETDILSSRYYYFATSKANGTNFIKIKDHYFGEQK